MSNMEVFNLILNIILAFCAISASIFAALTLKQAYVFKREEKESRAAFLAPSEEPGCLRITDLLDTEPRLVIKLKNYGLNPAEKINVILISFNLSDIDGTNKDAEPIFKLIFDGQNPIPQHQELIVHASTQKLNYKHVDDFKILASNFISMKVTYSDRILSKTFEEKFYWKIEEDGKLFEVTDEFIAALKKQCDKHFAI